MKIRIGFVSNSSAASFILIWGYRKEDKAQEYDAVQIVDNLLGLSFTNERDIERLKSGTRICQEVDEYIFLSTSASTCMYNDDDDFGREIKYLTSFLESGKDPDYFLIHKEVFD
jgi:hypothetical protein